MPQKEQVGRLGGAGDTDGRGWGEVGGAGQAGRAEAAERTADRALTGPQPVGQIRQAAAGRRPLCRGW